MKRLKGTTYDDENDKHASKSTHIDRPSAEEWKDGVTDENTDNEACGNRNVDIERLFGVKTCSLQEDDRVTGQWVAIEDLGGPCHTVLCSISKLCRRTDVDHAAYNFCAAQIRASEAVKVACALSLGKFQFVGVANIGNRCFDLLSLVRTVTSKTHQ